MFLNQVFKFFNDFWPPFWSSGATKNRKNQAQFMFLCLEGPLDRFGTTLGSILDPFWGNFGVVLSSFLMFFRRFSVRCPILFERCSWCWVFPSVGFVFSVFLSPKTLKRKTKRRRKRKRKIFFVHRVFFQLASVTWSV